MKCDFKVSNGETPNAEFFAFNIGGYSEYEYYFKVCNNCKDTFAQYTHWKIIPVDDENMITFYKIKTGARPANWENADENDNTVIASDYHRRARKQEE